MPKIASVKTTKDEKVREAKRAFILGLLDLSWKLAGSFLAPVAIGLVLDSSRSNSKTFTTIGIFTGLVLAFLVIFQLAKNSGVDK
jgi:F0F1-type ATP synthase assembly protein I